MMHTATWKSWLLLLAALCLAGCGPRQTPGAKKVHVHPEKGPHDGVIAEWGEEEYHPEFTVDHDKKQVTVYILDGEVAKPKAIPAESITVTITNLTPPLTLQLKAEPMADDPKGHSSRFVATDEKLGKVMDFKGTISGKVGDKPYSGEFDETKGGHGHKH
jgi:hypothetical protein